MREKKPGIIIRNKSIQFSHSGQIHNLYYFLNEPTEQNHTLSALTNKKITLKTMSPLPLSTEKKLLW